MFQPKLFTTLKDYTKQQFFSDAIAGVIVGIVAIPLAIAFGIASGVSPESGLITAIVAGFFISVLGGSRVQIGGPTGAFVVIVYGIVQKYGFEGLVIATMLAGVLLIVMGLARFGAVIKFVPYPVIVGFTSGIAVVIFSSQVKDFLGLSIDAIPVDFPGKWLTYLEHVGSTNLYALALGVLTVLVIAVWPRISRRVPGSLIALVLTSWIAAAFQWPVETIGSRFGELPHTIPALHAVPLDFATIQTLFQPAFTIAFLAAIESLLSAVVADGMIGGSHRSNMELVAQGVANIGSAIFGGMPATGAIARTVTNIKNGGRTPVAGIVHALTVLLAVFFFGSWIRLVPLASLAGILVVVSYHMSEWRSFFELLKGLRGSVIVLVATFAVTVLVDLTAAIELGMVLSAFLFVKRMASVKNIRLITRSLEDEPDDTIRKTPVPRGVEVYEIDGPLFFGAADQFDEIDRIVAAKPKVRVLRFKDVPFLDATALQALRSFHRKCKSRHIHLMITGLHEQPMSEAVKAELNELIGEENVFSDLDEALSHAERLATASDK